MNFAIDLMNFILIISFVAVVLAQIMSMIRLLIGPTTGDRILALDTMVVNVIALVVLLGISQGTRIYFEVSLIIAMLGFVSAFCIAGRCY